MNVAVEQYLQAINKNIAVQAKLALFWYYNAVIAFLRETQGAKVPTGLIYSLTLFTISSKIKCGFLLTSGEMLISKRVNHVSDNCLVSQSSFTEIFMNFPRQGARVRYITLFQPLLMLYSITVTKFCLLSPSNRSCGTFGPVLPNFLAGINMTRNNVIFSRISYRAYHLT